MRIYFKRNKTFFNAILDFFHFDTITQFLDISEKCAKMSPIANKYSYRKICISEKRLKHCQQF